MASADKDTTEKPIQHARGVSRVLQKLRTSMEAKNFYEAHQMYRTLYFRYSAQAKYDELLELLYSGAVTMLDHLQYGSGADLGLLIIQTLESAETTNLPAEEWMKRLGELIGKIKPCVNERETVLEKAIKWSGTVAQSPMGHPLMHKLIAQIMYNENNLPQARYHYPLSRDGFSCAFLLIELSQAKGYAGEVDLFVAQMVLQLLCLKELTVATETFATYIKFHPRVACTDPPFARPLLNFLFFLLQAIEQEGRKYAMFRALCDLYKPALERDPSYDKYLRKIGVMFFGASQPEQSRSYAFGDLLNQFIQDLSADYEDDPTNGEGGGGRADTEIELGSSMHGDVD
ncbi:golgi family to ER traffic protein 4 [Anopheles darlingi]|uniref:Golgi family to ER traffic protein 4 n=1 Tax=Anopheles darlingi TaxID=43151 RepID=W5J998_ANODA|nr:Golgi to ER traffic protein 4 homolog [Anopheles darlingi]XP_049536332.1 Golgi to ER traffic protein 4 homolog [Anopheles darlingi]ETN61032.1 golgi family to ER traffic protein 4 [Anopheles darlingi]